jgi:hypothetical protein
MYMQERILYLNNLKNLMAINILESNWILNYFLFFIILINDWNFSLAFDKTQIITFQFYMHLRCNFSQIEMKVHFIF